ncbi:hypothetical protein [Nostoc flagelliforme]|uniref:hypothetical protein n=1 Tax=Nostoc flagelliforme TaxID=1306274 RepID=UPI0026B587BB
MIEPSQIFLKNACLRVCIQINPALSQLADERNTSKPQSFKNERKNRGFSHRESVSKHHW